MFPCLFNIYVDGVVREVKARIMERGAALRRRRSETESITAFWITLQLWVIRRS